MANLEDLNRYDSEFRAAREDFIMWQRDMAANPKMWTDAQQKNLSLLFGGVYHLGNAVAELVHNNR
jgi:hypothetical protein